ncbi:hypothetical protein ACQPW3_16405 [Actinosynnema sp. CA-248983]
MTPDEAATVLTAPDSSPEDRYQAHADLTSAAASGDPEAQATLRWLRWNRSGRSACDVD